MADGACKELEEYWQEAIDWQVVKDRLARIPALAGEISIDELQCPANRKSDQFFGVHPLARELTLDADRTNCRDLATTIDVAMGLDGGPRRVKKLARLGNRSVDYWSWLTELEAAEHFHEKGVDVRLTSDTCEPDLELRMPAGSIWCEVTASFRQEAMGFFELKQLLDHEYRDKRCSAALRYNLLSSPPKLLPRAVWAAFESVRARLPGEGAFEVWLMRRGEAPIIRPLETAPTQCSLSGQGGAALNPSEVVCAALRHRLEKKKDQFKGAAMLVFSLIMDRGLEEAIRQSSGEPVYEVPDSFGCQAVGLFFNGVMYKEMCLLKRAGPRDPAMEELGRVIPACGQP